MPDNTLHIVSFIVHVKPDALAATVQWLAEQPNCDIRGEDEAGKLVVVAENNDEKALLQLMETVRDQPGVLDAALVYHEVLAADTADEPQD
ncbi:chaperone NapD [Halomonas vilamensis]|uniref:Chaperone NapD n=1 Tax=Vreelandella vilamensis TaxID=531309 RepID=A0ABU1H4S9_9GAMM|nr:chaperone NapD [Halomonas vilamensis]MDR5899317.1 chaperone NapD [Halomonas vilamensis]